MQELSDSEAPNSTHVPIWPGRPACSATSSMVKSDRRPGQTTWLPSPGVRDRAVAVWAVLLACLMIFSTTASSAEETVGIFTYHTHPPFITGQNQGLTYDLAEFLTSKSSGRFVFVVTPMSRPRLNKSIEQSQAAIVPWVNPAWFKDKAETRYLWSRHPLMEDANGVVSRQDTRIDYEGPASLSGLTFGGIRGHVYTGIDPYIEQSNTTRRVDSDNHLTNFGKLQDGRIDVTLIPESAALYLIKEHGLEDALYISSRPHSSYQRRVMVPGGRTDLMAFVDGVLSESSKDSEWLEIIERYR